MSLIGPVRSPQLLLEARAVGVCLRKQLIEIGVEADHIAAGGRLECLDDQPRLPARRPRRSRRIGGWPGRRPTPRQRPPASRPHSAMAEPVAEVAARRQHMGCRDPAGEVGAERLGVAGVKPRVGHRDDLASAIQAVALPGRRVDMR